jgi:hypothetical protein
VAEQPLQPLSGRTAAAIERLRLDAAAAEVVRAFAAADLECLLLKGRSLDAWLFPEGDRLAYLDVDLLIEPSSEALASEVLQRIGFERRFDENVLPEWWREHGSEWSRAEDGALVDLHRRLSGIGLKPEAAWRVLRNGADTLSVGRCEIWTLGLPSRALHVALHAAHHGAEGPKSLDDLERVLEVADEDLWMRAAEIARELEATDAFAAGLRLRSDGAALADRLGLPAGSSVEVAMRAATAPPVALGIEQFARAASWRARAEILWHKLFPPPAFVRHWSPKAAESRGQLALAYVRRPFWLLLMAPRGLRAWRAARRRVR